MISRKKKRRINLIILWAHWLYCIHNTWIGAQQDTQFSRCRVSFLPSIFRMFFFCVIQLHTAYDYFSWLVGWVNQMKKQRANTWCFRCDVWLCARVGSSIDIWFSYFYTIDLIKRGNRHLCSFAATKRLITKTVFAVLVPYVRKIQTKIQPLTLLNRPKRLFRHFGAL